MTQKHIFAGTVLNTNANRDKEGNAQPGGSLLVDFKVVNGEAMAEPTLAQIRVNDEDAYQQLLTEGLGKGATVGCMASGIHEWDADRDRTLKAKGNLPSRPIRRFNGLDLTTVGVLKGVKSFNVATTQDETKARGVTNIVSALAASALGALSNLGKRPATTAGEPTATAQA